MHLLFLTSLVPGDEPSTGFEIANAAIIAGLRSVGARVTVAGFARPGEGRPARQRIVFGEIVPENAGAGVRQKLAWIAKALATNLPVAAAKLRVLSDDTMRRTLAAAGPFDGVVLNSVQLPIAYPFLAGLGPTIYVAHNVEHRSALENAAAARDVVQRLLYARESRLLKRAEIKLCRDAAFVLTLAEDDLAPLGVDDPVRGRALALSIGRPADRSDASRAVDIGLIGTWSWAPNRVGLDWFVSDVVPLLPPQITVAVAGRCPGAPGVPSNVRFVGRVPDAQAFVRSARVLALATKAGTGVQLKTIEALEEGLACVATPLALRGIARPLPRNVGIANDPRAFADALVSLVEADRRGEPLRLDGSGFAGRQRASAEAALSAALDAIGARGVKRRTPLSAPAVLEPVAS